MKTLAITLAMVGFSALGMATDSASGVRSNSDSLGTPVLDLVTPARESSGERFVSAHECSCTEPASSACSVSCSYDKSAICGHDQYGGCTCSCN